jgi:hypothetical protein
MPNHIHLVVQQGSRPLAEFMQPILRRIALLVHRRYRREGHVFERRYRDALCADAEHLRNTIAYVHLNPVRASLVLSADEYAWTSHHSFCGSAHAEDDISTMLARENALRLFASSDVNSRERCAGEYRAFIQWRMQMDAWIMDSAEELAFHPPSPPSTAAGDSYWQQWFAPASPHERERTRPRSRPDLRDIALASLACLAPAMPLDDFRAGGVGPQLVRVRRHFILRALAAGYSGRKIARFLSVSPSTVSSTRAAAPVKTRSI